MSVPGEDPAVIPGRRSFAAVIRDVLRRRARDAAELRESVAYWRWMTERPDSGRHRAAPGPVSISVADLPGFRPRPSTALLHGGQPPWAQAPAPGGGQDGAAVSPPVTDEPQPLRAWSPGDEGDPPTIVMNVIRPAIAGDLAGYLDSLPAYGDGSGPKGESS